ncbi:MAG: glycosyltransferase family 39 protein [Alphaproteobacteria bacterium]
MNETTIVSQNIKYFLCFTGLCVIILITQYLQNVYATELLSDANGHYVTTLLAHDYIKAGFPGNPVSFAVDYFIHYPSIRIGNNPPTFYVLSSLWALITTDSIHAALVLSAILGAVYCIFTLILSSRVLGMGAGVIIAFAVALLPLFRDVAGSFLIDIPIGIFCLAAILSYARFLNTQSARSAVLFSLLAAAALMIKLSALFLAVMVPMAILISGKFYLLRNKYFWLPVLIIGVLILPWYLFTFENLTEGAKKQWTILFPLQALTEYLSILASNITLPGIALLGAGVIERIRFIRSNPNDAAADLWSVIIALLAAVVFFQALMPTNILDRYLITALAPAMILVWRGARVLGEYISDVFGRRGLLSENLRNRIPHLVCAAIILIIMGPALHIKPATGNRMAEVARKVSQTLPASNPVVMIASDGVRESSFIAQLAQVDRARPSLFAIRASRVLGKEEGFMNIDYKPKFNSPEEVLAELERLSVTMVVLDRAKQAQEWRHNRDIAWLADHRPELWRPVGSIQNPGNDGALSLLVLKSSEAKMVDFPLLRREFRPNSGNIGTED